MSAPAGQTLYTASGRVDGRDVDLSHWSEGVVLVRCQNAALQADAPCHLTVWRDGLPAFRVERNDAGEVLTIRKEA